MIEIIVDSFAGGGGASTGIELALGRSPDIAINHDATALAMHEVNHPDTLHLKADVWSVDPLTATAGRPVGLMWASPDCKHFSKAKGGKPVEKKIRGLAWVVVHWANTVRPRVIILENVEEFQTWGPLADDGRPCPLQKGATFKRWIGELEALGYVVDWRELRACDYGAPTIRKRLFLIARCDGGEIVWPDPTHGDPKCDAVKSGRLKPWRTAAEIIDWSRPCPSIFASAAEIMEQYGLRAVRPLQNASMARLAKGVRRYVVDAAEPFIINLTHQGGERTEDTKDPLATITGAHRGEKALVMPFVSAAQQGGSIRPANAPLHTATASPKDQNQVVAAHLMTMRNAQKPFNEADKPTHTITSGGAGLSLAAAFLAQNNIDGRTGEGNAGRPIAVPLSTILQSGSHQGVVAANLLRQFGTGIGSPIEQPARTVMADGQGKTQLSVAFLQKYYGSDQDPQLAEPLHTATTKDRFGLGAALLDLPPFQPEHADRARKVADLLRSYGLWDDREFVTVVICGITCIIVDIGMRMLVPPELFLAQSFPRTYVIDRRPDGSAISKTDQVSKCGNSVCPVLAAALVAANYSPRDVEPAPQFMEAAE
jgi:DNA (cytosine-5)-methyltransferase 1